MSVEFNRVSGGKYGFIEDNEVKNLIDESGRKSVVFVEGPTDQHIYTIIFGEEEELENKISFVPAKGHEKVDWARNE